ncbi:MAG: hypothetical protein COB85_01565 [Bacteroidetes bacterium]|nr:MAG: hypothetical protein COB85_01565 [Bacteroidota bacterium]
MRRKIVLALLSFTITLSLSLTQAQIPVMVKDINPGSASSEIWYSPVPAWQGIFFFCADDGVTGRELWKSDGTNSGTEMVKDIHPTAGSSCVNFQYVDSIMYFTATNGLYLDTIYWGQTDSILYINERRTLWVTDGTDNGTIMIKDVIPASNMVSLGGGTFFLAADGLWKTNGTENGTALVKGFTMSQSSEIIVYKNFLFFAGSVAGYNFELWTSNGTGAGTELFKTINIFNNSYGSSPQDFIIAGDLLYFTADNMVYDNTPLPNREVWVTDGTAAGTRIVKDIFPDVGTSSPTLYAVLDDILYFTAHDSIYYPGWNYNRELWKTDGTEDGTIIVKDINYHKPEPLPWGTGGNANAKEVIIMNGDIYLVANDGAAAGYLWKSDGTTTGTVKIISSDTLVSSTPSKLISAGYKFYFKAGTGSYGIELWESDGTGAGTKMVADIYPGSNGGDPQNMAHINGYLYFTIDNGTEGQELWRIESPTGIDEQAIKEESLFSIYPNPNSGRFTISFSSGTSASGSITVTSIFGQVVYNERFSRIVPGSKRHFNVNELLAGVYFVSLETEEGSYVRKIIIL